MSISSGTFSFEPSDWSNFDLTSHWLKKLLSVGNSVSDRPKMKINKSFILTAKNKKNKPLKKWPIETTAGFYADRVTDASCIIEKENLAIYEGRFSVLLSH